MDDKNLKPLSGNLCDDCNLDLVKRNDDTEDTFKVRFESYLKNTSPIINYYKEQHMLTTIDAMSGLDNMLNLIIKEAKDSL